MNPLLKINFSKRKKPASLLGLALDGSRLDGVVLRRTNGSLQVQQTFSVTLSLDPLTAAPELVGREIRNHLDAAGVRERHCVVGLPLKWALTARTELPPLPEADAASLLQLEAERGFPCDVATLQLAHSRCPLPGGGQQVTLAGIPGGQVAALEQVLAAAKLKPISFALGVAALQPVGAMFGVPPSGGSAGLPPKGGTPNENNGVLALAIGESMVSLQINCGGGVAALRALEGAIENEGGRRALQSGLVAREARITLGQLPAALRDAVKRIRIFGPRDLAQPLADEMELRFEPMGLSVEVVSAYAPDEFGVQLPSAVSVSPAFSLAAGCLVERPPVFEFLPPKPTAWQQITAKYFLRPAALRRRGGRRSGGHHRRFVFVPGNPAPGSALAMVGNVSQSPGVGRHAKADSPISPVVRRFLPRFEHPAAAHHGFPRKRRRHGQGGGDPQRQRGDLLRQRERQRGAAADVEPVARSARREQSEGGPAPRQIADAIHV